MLSYKCRRVWALCAFVSVVCLSRSATYAAFPAFEYHLIDRIGNQMGQTSLVDIDKDGDLDIVEAEADTVDARVFWFENKGGAKDWMGHLISPDHTNQDFHSLAVADFDNDGDLDAFSGGGPLTEKLPHKWFIWENADGKAGAWKEQLIFSGKECHEAKAADVDADGDIDICSKPWNGDEHVYLRNMLKENSSK